MRIQTILFTLVISLFIFSCNEKSKYINGSVSCELKLHANSTYKFSYPTFLGKASETGVYELDNDKIILSRKSNKKMDSINIGYYYSWNGTDKPDSLYLRFKNIYNEQIKTKIKFNHSIQEFESNELGEINVAYEKLESLGILEPNEVIKNFTLFFGDNIYHPNMTYYSDSRRPQRIDFKLNQFIGEDYTILKRIYRCDNDTIYINDISRKSIGKYNKLVKTK